MEFGLYCEHGAREGGTGEVPFFDAQRENRKQDQDWKRTECYRKKAADI